MDERERVLSQFSAEHRFGGALVVNRPTVLLTTVLPAWRWSISFRGRVTIFDVVAQIQVDNVARRRCTGEALREGAGARQIL